MLARIFSIAAFLLAATKANTSPTHRAANSLPNCAAAPAECQCPPGTTLQDSTTYALIGAAAKDIKAIAGSFFDTAWLGASPDAVSGRDNTPGATRTLTGATDVGTYTFVEKIVTYEESDNGSFTVLFEQGNGPIPYKNATGSFSGYWDTLSVKYAAERESILYWDIYLCWTGVVSDFVAFHESAIKNLTSILEARGQLGGHSEEPVSFS